MFADCYLSSRSETKVERVKGGRNLYPPSGKGVSSPFSRTKQVLNDGTNTFLYDNEGNTTQKTVIATGRVTQYSWDHRNRLTQVQERVSAAGAVLETIQYSYDAFDRRTIKRLDNDVNGTFERYWAYLNDGSHTILELEDSDGQGAAQSFRVSNRFLHGDAVDMVLADEQYSSGQGFQLGSTTANATQGTTLWTLGDNLGSIRDVVDNNGIVCQHVVYNSFGVRLSEIDRDATEAIIDSSSPAAIDTLFGYTGRDWDADTGLQYNRARWYDPAQGRWLTQDPIGFAAGDVNLYRYVGNSPTNATDPSGLDGRTVNGHTFIGEGHHKIPVSVIKALLGWLPKDLLEYLDGDDNLICQPKGTGHDPSYHGRITGYSKYVANLVTEELKALRDELKLPNDAKIPADKQRMLLEKLLTRINSQPLDTFIGGFNDAVRNGGTSGVKKWGDRVKALGGKIKGFASASAKCVGPVGMISGLSSPLEDVVDDMERIRDNDGKWNWSDFWDSYFQHSREDPLFIMPGMPNPYNPGFGGGHDA
jgi:RHS repeat-associated protein